MTGGLSAAKLTMDNEEKSASPLSQTSPPSSSTSSG
eukprot:gene21455-25803_t